MLVKLASLLLVGVSAFAQENKHESPRITAIAPLHLVAGETQIIHVRGLKLNDATELRSTPALPLSVKEKKDAAPPNGLEAKDVGDQEIVAEITIPIDCAVTTLGLSVVAPTGTSQERNVFVIRKEDMAKEKEPNNGFAESQIVDQTKPITGRIEPEKDVDVFRVDGRAGKAVSVRVTAASASSLLDPILSVFDSSGHLLGMVDDASGSRDPQLTVTPSSDGPLCFVVCDAHDRGGPWHEYRLQFDPEP